MSTIAALVLVLSMLAAPVRADVIETCPDGQRYESNPTAEGAMHHAGGRCVDDPSAGGCDVGHGSPSALVVIVAALAAILVSRGRAAPTPRRARAARRPRAS